MGAVLKIYDVVQVKEGKYQGHVGVILGARYENSTLKAVQVYGVPELVPVDIVTLQF